jgi:Zn-dependent M28 family amino/carboxypeptidase
MKIATRASWIRLGILTAILGLLLSWAGCTMIRMPLKSYAGALPPLTAGQIELRDRLKRGVEALAGEIGERNVFLPKKLQAAAEYIEGAFSTAGYKVIQHSYTVMGESCHNLEVEIPGTTRPQEIVIVGAHYDSVAGCPGANDNGSGVAALLALAEKFAGAQPLRTLRFVAFVNEEPPFFWTDNMGSRVYAKMLRERGDQVVAMISLETIGYYSDAQGSQQYPSPLSLVYPSTGNFIAFVGNIASRALVRDCITVFRQEAQFPSEGAALPQGLPGVGWSDHWSFWEEGYPALMLTDTAPFRYRQYHTEEDTPDKLDYERMARVVSGMEKVIESLANPGSRR